MKHIIVALAALALLTCPASVLAENAGPAPDSLPENTVLSVDLDGDGAAEQVSWAMVPGQYDTCLTLTVTPAGGEALTYPVDITGEADVRILDLDGDGRQEILLSGDVMSDDYVTWCLRYGDGALYEVLFPDCSRGQYTDGYFKYGYGRITAVEGDRLTLSGSQDMLGTWFACRTVRLTPHDRFEFDDDGLWRRDIVDPADPELWGYAAIVTKVDLPYTGADGQAATLPAGTKILITATDKAEAVWFTTQGGVTGIFSISPDYERGWGWMVDGIGEDEGFGPLPYAD